MKTKFALPPSLNTLPIIPKVQVGVIAKDWNEIPNVTFEGITKGTLDPATGQVDNMEWDHDVIFDPRGGFNSINYFEQGSIQNQKQYN